METDRSEEVQGNVGIMIKLGIAFVGMMLFGTVALAQESSDLEHCREILVILRSEEIDPDQAREAWEAVKVDSPYRNIANHAYALVLIRLGNYPTAWKCVQSSELKEDAPRELRLQHESLLLWLALESGKANIAEPQFKQLVRYVLQRTPSNTVAGSDLALIGGVMAMVERIKEPLLPLKTLAQAKQAIEKLEKSEVDKFRLGYEAVANGVRLLEEKHDELATMERAQLQAKIEEWQVEIESLDVTVAEQQQDVRVSLGSKKDLEAKRKTFKKKLDQINSQLAMETPGKPALPIEPRRPNLPQIVYRLNSQTNQREIDRDATERRRNEYDRDMRDYDRDYRNYLKASQEYPQKLQAWKDRDQMRRSALQNDRAAVIVQLDEVAAQLKEIQSIIADSAKELSEDRDNLKAKKAELQIAQRAAQHLLLAIEPKPSFIRPSNLNLLDWNMEATRIEKLLRDPSD